MAGAFDTPLPVDEVLAPLGEALASRRSAVLVAPPGAGKTTRVPLALLDAGWLAGQKILVLEPRRIAARGAAERMAGTLGERVGATIGLRARLGTRVGPATRIEVVTEGVFTRMILDDPSLEGIGAVVFDEFHERSLDADFGLALALDVQRGLREDLRLLVMSATLDGARVADLIGGAPVIESAGRAHPVETRYLGRAPDKRIEDRMVEAVLAALRAEHGSILSFLPGQGEIRRVAERLAERITDSAIEITPLYGAMDPAAQDRAIAPAGAGLRKIVLATSIAETSITIEGVRVVIDSGIARVPRYEVDTGVTRLETVRVSRAAADQRRGRAGRTEPGVCYRLWDEPETQALAPFADPEIKHADLAGLMLDCAAWGVTDPATLTWLDPPPASAVAAARRQLSDLDAIDADGRMTPLGKRLRDLPLPAPLARMLLGAAERGAADLAADLAAVIVERGLGGTSLDVTQRLEAFRRDRSGKAEAMRSLARGWATQARAGSVGARGHAGETDVADLLALAFPDRIAKARGAPGHFLLANGRAASVEATEALAKAPALVVADLAGRAAATRILLAAPLTTEDLDRIAGARMTSAMEITFDRAAVAVRARRVRRLGAITLASEPAPVPADATTAAMLARGLADIGIDRLAWSKAQAQWRGRIAFLRAAQGEVWPDVSDAALAASAETWLAPFLDGKSSGAEVTAEVLGQALDAMLPWDLKRRLEADAPTHFEAPTGNRHAIRWDGPGAPALAIRVQELFGLTAHPSVAGGRLPLTLELLSPAHRPIQITRDLPGFWAGSWRDVKADMKGRYPKHVWPDDPATAAPTARAKPRGT
jgi:ATP-dependent helicase HrpB